MLGLGLWKLEDDGMLSLEDGDLRLLVQQKAGSALFLVRQHCIRGPSSHPASGTASGKRWPMQKRQRHGWRPPGGRASTLPTAPGQAGRMRHECAARG